MNWQTRRWFPKHTNKSCTCVVFVCAWRGRSHSTICADADPALSQHTRLGNVRETRTKGSVLGPPRPPSPSSSPPPSAGSSASRSRLRQTRKPRLIASRATVRRKGTASNTRRTHLRPVSGFCRAGKSACSGLLLVLLVPPPKSCPGSENRGARAASTGTESCATPASVAELRADPAVR